jgi:Kef-type K+ transport system membrane component KefB
MYGGFMEHMYITASLWLGLAVISAIIAYHLKISIALIEICVGIIAGTLMGKYLPAVLDNNADWLKFLAGSGAIFLTFLAGAELDKKTISLKWKEVTLIGIIGFLAPFLGCSAAMHYLFNWTLHQSLLAGIALSTTSMAVVYSVMVETGLNSTEFGKGILGSCFINDIGTVIGLGLIFAPFTYKTLIFIGVAFFALLIFPYITNHLTNIYGNRTAAIRVKWISFFLFSLGALALWSGSEAVLPAYIAGIALAEFASKNNHWLRRMRTLTVGFLTPFYFIRAGSLVSISAIFSAPLVLLVLFLGKVITKTLGLYPAIAIFRKEKNERWYYNLMMCTGLTFGTISAMYGYSHGIINGSQYSLLVIAVVASAVIPTMIASFKFTPKHLLSLKHHITELKEEIGEE